MNETENMEKAYNSPHGTGTKIASNPRDCKYWDSCSSNLCPLDPDIQNKVWCPEEQEYNEICRNPEFQNLQFIVTQRKIARALRNNLQDREDYFNYEMLNRNIIVKRGIKGIPEPPETIKDSMKWYREHELKWIQNHPEISEDKVRTLKERGKFLSEFKRKTLPDNTFSEIVSSKGVINRLNNQSLQNTKENDTFSKEVL